MSKKIDLMIIGAEKSGTSSLSRYLSEHPEVAMHKQREMNYFLIEEEYKSGLDQAFISYYAPTLLERRKIVAKCVGIMDYSIGIERIYKHNPTMHLVAVLRNPITRAYSAYWYARRRAWENISTFEQAIELELRSDTVEVDSIRTKKNHFLRAYLRRGRYYEIVQNILERFPKNQVHLYLLEDLKANPYTVLSDVCSILDINQNFVAKTSKVHNKAAMPKSVLVARLLASHSIKKLVGYFIPANLKTSLKMKIEKINDRDFNIPPMSLETYQRLRFYYEPLNDKLSEKFNLDLSIWDLNNNLIQ